MILIKGTFKKCGVPRFLFTTSKRLEGVAAQAGYDQFPPGVARLPATVLGGENRGLNSSID